MSQRSITIEQQEESLEILKERFEKNMNRHEGLSGEDIVKRLE